MDSPRQDGFYIRTWATAYARTRDERFLKAIETLLQRLENKPHPGASVASLLSLAIDCDGAAHHVPEPLASRLRSFAAHLDERFCALRHDLAGKGGFFM